ncbi:MAG: hypothetical protein N3A38_00190 [Planctomycetota bacterium]|nr:hypothetical protein [Planctomycetota bacterium]
MTGNPVENPEGQGQGQSGQREDGGGGFEEEINKIVATRSGQELAARSQVQVVKKKALIELILKLLNEHGAKSNQELLAQIAQYQLQYAQKSQENEQLRAELQKALSEIERLRRELEAAQAAVAAAQAQLAAVPQRMAEMEKELRQKTDELELLREKLVRMEGENAKLAQEIVNIQRFKGEEATLQAELEKLRKHIQILQARVSDLELGLDFFELCRPLDEGGIEAAVRRAMEASATAKRSAKADTPEGRRAAVLAKALEDAAVAAKANREAFKGLVGIMNEEKGSIGVIVDAVKAREAVDRALATIDLAGRALE